MFLLALVLAPAALASEEHPTQAELEGELVCPTCHTTLDQSNAPVALRTVGLDDDVGTPRGRTPVDGADVVTDDVLAQRVELGASTLELNGGAAVDLAKARQA